MAIYLFVIGQEKLCFNIQDNKITLSRKKQAIEISKLTAIKSSFFDPSGDGPLYFKTFTLLVNDQPLLTMRSIEHFKSIVKELQELGFSIENAFCEKDK